VKTQQGRERIDLSGVRQDIDVSRISSGTAGQQCHVEIILFGIAFLKNVLASYEFLKANECFVIRRNLK